MIAVGGAQAIKEEIDRLNEEFETARRAGNLKRAAEIQYSRIPDLKRQM